MLIAYEHAANSGSNFLIYSESYAQTISPLTSTSYANPPDSFTNTYYLERSITGGKSSYGATTHGAYSNGRATAYEQHIDYGSNLGITKTGAYTFESTNTTNSTDPLTYTTLVTYSSIYNIETPRSYTILLPAITSNEAPSTPSYTFTGSVLYGAITTTTNGAASITTTVPSYYISTYTDLSNGGGTVLAVVDHTFTVNNALDRFNTLYYAEKKEALHVDAEGVVYGRGIFFKQNGLLGMASCLSTIILASNHFSVDGTQYVPTDTLISYTESGSIPATNNILNFNYTGTYLDTIIVGGDAVQVTNTSVYGTSQDYGYEGATTSGSFYGAHINFTASNYNSIVTIPSISVNVFAGTFSLSTTAFTGQTLTYTGAEGPYVLQAHGPGYDLVNEKYEANLYAAVVTPGFDSVCQGYFNLPSPVGVYPWGGHQIPNSIGSAYSVYTSVSYSDQNNNTTLGHAAYGVSVPLVITPGGVGGAQVTNSLWYGGVGDTTQSTQSTCGFGGGRPWRDNNTNIKPIGVMLYFEFATATGNAIPNPNSFVSTFPLSGAGTSPGNVKIAADSVSYEVFTTRTQTYAQTANLNVNLSNNRGFVGTRPLAWNDFST